MQNRSELNWLNRNWALALITALGSMFCWWAWARSSGTQLSFWVALLVPIGLIALCTGLATSLSKNFWPVFLAATIVGTFVGIATGFFVIWPPPDKDAGALMAILMAPITAGTAVFSGAAILIGRRIMVIGSPMRDGCWIALVTFCALGPAIVLLVLR